MAANSKTLRSHHEITTLFCRIVPSFNKPEHQYQQLIPPNTTPTHDILARLTEDIQVLKVKQDHTKDKTGDNVLQCLSFLSWNAFVVEAFFLGMLLWWKGSFLECFWWFCRLIACSLHFRLFSYIIFFQERIY